MSWNETEPLSADGVNPLGTEILEDSHRPDGKPAEIDPKRAEAANKEFLEELGARKNG